MKNSKYKSFKQYVLFSLGELILIIAGILIAMNINNWNEKRISLKKANLYIDKVRKDLAVDTSFFEYAIKRIDLKIDYKKSLFNQDSLTKFSTIQIQGIVATGTNNISINNNAYKKMIESGIVTLEEKKFLFERLDAYYTIFSNYLNEFNRWEEKYASKDSDFWVYQNRYETTYFDSIQPIVNVEENRKKLLNIVNSVEGRNYINMSIVREQQMKDIYTKGKKRAKRLIKQIDSLQN